VITFALLLATAVSEGSGLASLHFAHLTPAVAGATCRTSHFAPRSFGESNGHTCDPARPTRPRRRVGRHVRVRPAPLHHAVCARYFTFETLNVHAYWQGGALRTDGGMDTAKPLAPSARHSSLAAEPSSVTCAPSAGR